MTTVALGLAVLVLAGFSLESQRKLQRAVNTPAVNPGTKAQVRARSLRSGTQVVAYFIGSSDCGASKNATIPESVAEIQRRLARKARMEGKTFASVGVAIDWDPTKGLSFLNHIGSFDEVSLGRNWANSIAVNYIWRELAGDAQIPQVVIVERSLDVKTTSFDFGPDQLVARKIGVEAINTFAQELAKP